MKLTADLVVNSASYLNTIDQRELLLRGHKIELIENLGSTRDLNDSIDLTDNDIRVLGNFPKLQRLKTLLIAHNRISHIQSTLSQSLPNLENLILSNNSLSELTDLNALTGLRHLHHLSIVNNPVTHRENYRLYVIWRAPSVRVLDFERVRDKERERAKVLFGESVDKPSDLASTIINQQSLKAGSTNAEKQFRRLLTDEDKEKLRQQLKTAPSLEEVERIEQQLKSGYL